MDDQRQPIGHGGAWTAWPVVSAAGADTDTYGSTSTLSTETAATGSHVLTVADYSGTKELHAAGGHVTSESFTVGGCSWHISCSLHGFAAFYHNTADWICFALYPEPPGAGTDLDATVRFRYILLDQSGQPVQDMVTIENERPLSSMLGSWTCTMFMERKRLESYSNMEDNTFSVRCDVTLEATKCKLSGAMALPDLRRHFRNLLASGVGADVTLKVGGEAFPAHRSVLAARSPVFKAELFSGPPDKEDEAAARPCLRIHDIEPSVFRALLHFIYTDSLPEIDADDESAMAEGLLVAAQRYELEALKWICEDVLDVSCPRRAAKQLLSLADQMRAKVGGCPL